MITGKTCHCVQLGFTGAPKSLGIANKSMFTVELAPIYLKKQRLECIEHLGIFGKRHPRIISRQIQQTAFLGPFG